MKKIYILSALLCAAAMSFTSCIEETLVVPVKPAKVGDEIAFGARAGFESSNPGTRTAYGPEYEEGDRKFQRIDWLDGSDMVEIYSPEASGLNPSTYVVMNDTDPDKYKDYAVLSRHEDYDASLQWGSDNDHNFYAMYPSSLTFRTDTDEILKEGVKMTGTVVNGIIPHSQNHAGVTRTDENGTEAVDGKHWVVKPNMDYAYMVARSTGNREDGVIPLSFHPIVTAVEIQLTFNKPESSGSGDGSVTTYAEKLTITDVKVESKDIITGAFHTDLKDWNSEDGYPACEVTSLQYENSARVSLWHDTTPDDPNDSAVSAITVEDGGSITFTVFLLPGKDDIDNLKVYFSTDGGSAWVGKDLPGITIKKHKKNRIVNLALPVDSETTQVDVGNWISELIEQKPDTKLNKLSIPGTGGSFTFHSTGLGVTQQTLTIQQQWDRGIRAFEIVSNRPREVSNSLGGQPIRCNGSDMGDETVYSALKDLLDRVTEKDETTGEYKNSECAVAILTYQPEGGYVRRRANAYAQSLVTMLTTDDNGTNKCLGDRVDDMILYTSDLTIGEAKNKLIIICRINQEGEPEPDIDYEDWGGSPNKNDTTQTRLNYEAAEQLIADNELPVLLINGCGTAKDKWRRRGYLVNGTQARNLVGYGVDFDPATDVEPYLVQYRSGLSYLWRDYSAVTIDSDYIDFKYETNSDPCWFQEWSRVSPGGTNGFYTIERDWQADYRWAESYTEKYNHAVMTFQRAIEGGFDADPDTGAPGMVVINSLCGYFVDNTNSAYNQSYIPFGDGSYQGGTNGNIQALATKLNREFYQYVANSGIQNATGPTGIILMDFVSNVPSEEGAYMLPGVIIANNFKF